MGNPVIPRIKDKKFADFDLTTKERKRYKALSVAQRKEANRKLVRLFLLMGTTGELVRNKAIKTATNQSGFDSNESRKAAVKVARKELWETFGFALRPKMVGSGPQENGSDGKGKEKSSKPKFSGDYFVINAFAPLLRWQGSSSAKIKTLMNW